MTRAKKVSGKGTAAKGPPAGSHNNLHKHLESERILEHIADFEKSGGRVEKLGVTQVLLKIKPAEVIAPVAAPTAKPRGRPKTTR